jgi:hypothetical protein
MALFDRLSGLLAAGDEAFPALRQMFDSEPDLVPPAGPAGPGLQIVERED